MASELRRGGERRIPQRVRPWSALGYRDYRLLFFGQLFSNLGTWMQFTSLTYLIGVVLAQSSAQSSLNLGFLGAAQSIPALLCSPIAGFVADRFPRRRTLFTVAMGRSALAIALTLVSMQSKSWVIIAALLLAASFAAVQSFDFPTRQSWVPLIVPPQLLSNAVGLLGAANNLPLMVGPAIAGLLIGAVGVYTSFVVQAIAQIVVVILVASMRPVPVSSNTSNKSMLRELAGGISFVASHAVLGWVILTQVVISIFVRPFNLLLAGFAGHVLHVDARGYGTMLAMVGLGTFSGALLTATLQSQRRVMLFLGTAIFSSIALIALAFSREFALVLTLLTLIGFGQMVFGNCSVYLVQVLTVPEVRGRALSLLSMIVLGIIPAGTLLLGTIASVIGLPYTYALGGAVGIAFTLYVWFAQPGIRRSQESGNLTEPAVDVDGGPGHVRSGLRR